MVSMKDIAQRCGVSVATVSKALNGQPDIGPETRDRICAAAEEMGYVTNSAARALKANRAYNIGILFVDEQNSGLTHEYFSSVLESLKVEDGRVKMSGKGYGHGVGMSQWGAYAMAKEGKSAEEIVEHYFRNVTIAKAWE